VQRDRGPGNRSPVSFRYTPAMIDRLRTLPGITRRGLLVGAGLAAAPFVVRSRPAGIDLLLVPEDRLFPRPDLLIHPRALRQALEADAQPPKVLAATSIATYRDGHIRSAIHVWWQDTMELNTPYYGSVLKPDDDKGDQGRRIRFLERLGVTTGEWIVVYADRNPSHAARVCWFLRFLGYDARVLDGGYAGWLGIDAPVTTATPDVAESSNPAVTPTRDFYLFAGESVPFLADSNAQFVDLRDADEVSDGASAGRAIPEAVSLPRSSLVSADGLLLAPDALGQVISAAGALVARRDGGDDHRRRLAPVARRASGSGRRGSPVVLFPAAAPPKPPRGRWAHVGVTQICVEFLLPNARGSPPRDRLTSAGNPGPGADRRPAYGPLFDAHLALVG
jgi:3-mercaptopyruvate sulfurtransferase SseA